MRNAQFLSLTFLFFSLFFLTYASAEEEWTIKKLDNLVFANVSGEITHGDQLGFFIRPESNCEKVWNIFTVYTYEKPKDINDLQLRDLPIKINGKELTASVQNISPFLMGHRFIFSLGQFEIEDYVKFLNEFYKEFNKFEIEIIDGDAFKAAKYFDIRHNHWKLDQLVPSVLEAQELCQQIINKQL